MIAAVDAGERVLDVGCGNGIPATREMARRHAVVGLDISSEQIRRARENVPAAEFIHGDLASAAFAEPFAAISAFYVIEHLPREQHASLFASFHGWLRPGGYLLLTIEPEDEPGKIGDWLSRPMFFSQFDSSTTLLMLEQAGFELVDRAIEDQIEGGREVTYLWVLARRR